MKKFTLEEFRDRADAVNRAMRIFAHMTDNDMTKAFTAYQEILAEAQRDILIDAERTGSFTGSNMDNYERPVCPDCGEDMGFRVVPPNEEGIKTQLVHMPGSTCKTVLNFDLTMEQWQQELKRL